MSSSGKQGSASCGRNSLQFEAQAILESEDILPLGASLLGCSHVHLGDQGNRLERNTLEYIIVSAKHWFIVHWGFL